MLTSPWDLLLTALFAMTLALSLWWWTSASRSDVRDRVLHLNHAVMSAAMIVMIWWPFGRLGSWVQIAIFALLFLLVIRVDWQPVFERVGDTTAHVLMNLAMIWMLAAMPLLMGDSAMTPEAHADHAGHGGAMPSDASGMAMAGPDTWVKALNGVATAAVFLCGFWWLRQITRSGQHRAHAACHVLMAGGMAAMLILMVA
ncbi:DUF5134 domain-containing protein [Kribbella sp. NBC_00709]|uniref:DUF5134 domain-containing protein n=1 Tax=Kribbella sp. NBC_00709 TaxID=2975972 RepID=UPI002E2DF5E4|nr:DUF5134 domain-containing protein [Kribbella sp. NBC_00709]